MASSTALITICGSIPFSRLSASIFSYSALAMIALQNPNYAYLELGYQTSSLDVAHLDVQRARRVLVPPLLRTFFPHPISPNLNLDQPVQGTLQSTLEMTIPRDRLPGH